VGAWPVKPALGVELDTDHHFARGLLLYMPFLEGTGAPLDYALRRVPTRQNSPRWGGSPVGPAMAFVGASTQRLDWGTVPSLSAIPRLTIELRAKRVASEGFLVGRGSSNATSLHFGYRNSTAIFFRVGTGAAGADGEFAHSDTLWHTLTGVFDGTQTGNAARLKIYLDGVPQTLSFTGTIPAVTPTSTANFYANFIQSVSTYYNGTCASLAIWGRALEPAEIREREREPWALFAPEPIAEGPFGATGPTITFSDPTPVTTAERDEASSITATPDDVLDPIDTWAAEVDGEALDEADIDVTALGGGVERGTVEFPFRFGLTHEVVWTVTTASGRANVYTHTFTVRETNERRERVGLFAPYRAVRRERAELLTPGLVPARRERAHLTVAFGKAATEELAQLSVVEGLPTSYYRKEKVQVLAASLVDLPDAVSYSYEVGDQHNLEMALSLEVEGLDPTEMALAEEVNSAKTETEMPLSMEVAVPEETEASMTLEVGPLEESEMALAFEEEGAALEPLAGEAHSRSEPRAREEDT
jgi:hypothetical protein